MLSAVVLLSRSLVGSLLISPLVAPFVIVTRFLGDKSKVALRQYQQYKIKKKKNCFSSDVSGIEYFWSEYFFQLSRVKFCSLGAILCLAIQMVFGVPALYLPASIFVVDMLEFLDNHIGRYIHLQVMQRELSHESIVDMAFLIPWASAPILFACAACSVFPTLFIGTIAVVALGSNSAVILSKMEAVFSTTSNRLTELLPKESGDLGVGVNCTHQPIHAKALTRKNRGILEEDMIKSCRDTIETADFLNFINNSEFKEDITVVMG